MNLSKFLLTPVVLNPFKYLSSYYVLSTRQILRIHRQPETVGDL